VGGRSRPESRSKVTRGTCELLLTVAPFRAWRGSGVRNARGSNRLSRRLPARADVFGCLRILAQRSARRQRNGDPNLAPLRCEGRGSALDWQGRAVSDIRFRMSPTIRTTCLSNLATVQTVPSLNQSIESYSY